jgi:hypothetical protein
VNIALGVIQTSAIHAGITRLEATLNARFTGLESTMNACFDRLDRSFGNMNA